MNTPSILPATRVGGLGLFGLVLLALALLGCGQKAEVRKQTLYVFGTLVEISALTDDAAAFDAAIADLDALFQDMHGQWHAWQGEGELMRVNAALSRGEPVAVTAFTRPLLQASLEYSRASRGLFNPLIGCLVAAWGFHRDDPASASIASPAEVERCLAGNPKAEDLSWRDGVLSSSNRLAQFDLGGVAKGYALNLAIERLRRRGLSDTIVNAGGDLCVAGSKAGQPWHIAIRHPQGKGVLAGLQVADSECVLTSGNYERYHEQQGVRYGHIIDPRTGYPAGQVASATVIAENGGLADAAATALSVAGPQQWQAVAKAMGLQQVLLVDEQGNVHMTRAMAERVGFTENPAKVLLADF